MDIYETLIANLFLINIIIAQIGNVFFFIFTRRVVNQARLAAVKQLVSAGFSSGLRS